MIKSGLRSGGSCVFERKHERKQKHEEKNGQTEAVVPSRRAPMRLSACLRSYWCYGSVVPLLEPIPVPPLPSIPQPKWKSIMVSRTVVFFGTPVSALKSSCLTITCPRIIVPKSG